MNHDNCWLLSSCHCLLLSTFSVRMMHYTYAAVINSLTFPTAYIYIIVKDTSVLVYLHYFAIGVSHIRLLKQYVDWFIWNEHILRLYCLIYQDCWIFFCNFHCLFIFSFWLTLRRTCYAWPECLSKSECLSKFVTLTHAKPLMFFFLIHII